MINYHNKCFRVVENTSNGETSTETIFEYKQENEIISCSYGGGKIKTGNLLGTVDASGVINMSYHQINTKGELVFGTCTSKPVIMPNGKIKLLESWQWGSGDLSKGNSTLEEL